MEKWKRMLLKHELTSRPGSPDLLTTKGDKIGSIPDDVLRDEIIQRYNRGFINPEHDDLFDDILRLFGISTPEELRQQLIQRTNLEVGLRQLEHQLCDDFALIDDERLQAIGIHLIDHVRFIYNQIGG